MTTFFIVLNKFVAQNINDQHKIFNAEFVGMCMICPHVRFQMLIANGSLVVIVGLKLNIDFMQPSFCFLTFYELKHLNTCFIFFKNLLPYTISWSYLKWR
jgi:hypothetical protein